MLKTITALAMSAVLMAPAAMADSYRGHSKAVVHVAKVDTRLNNRVVVRKSTPKVVVVNKRNNRIVAKRAVPVKRVVAQPRLVVTRDRFGNRVVRKVY